MTKLCFLLFLLVICQWEIDACKKGATERRERPKWDGLKVTWGLNAFSSSYFVSQPRTAAEALSQGYQQISPCDGNAKWRGARYVKDGDHAVTLLYDVNGYIAGIQTSVPKSVGSYPLAQLQPPFVEDGDNWVISAYFTDPAKICTTGRSSSEFTQQGTGTNLYLQNSTRPEDSIAVPLKESDIGSTRWTEGKCFYSMGKHYWYDLSPNMNCDSMFPVFLLYNSGELNAFGWALGANLPSARFEHPRSAFYGFFMKEVPSCLYDRGTLSTMHIFLTSSTVSNLC